jgi:hypothetical protein
MTDHDLLPSPFVRVVMCFDGLGNCDLSNFITEYVLLMTAINLTSVVNLMNMAFYNWNVERSSSN